MTGNLSQTATCYIYRKTPQELATLEDAPYLAAVEKST